MKKLLPTGFNSWITFRDYLESIHPEFFEKKIKTVHFMSYAPIEEGGVIETYSISIAALERLCWKEIQPLRINSGLTYDAGSILHANYFMANRMSPVIKLLWKLEINKYK